MNYNNGHSDTSFFGCASNEELQERARDYSEGNKDLESILLNLWERNIQTKGCCIGHEKSYDKEGYLAFKLDNENSFKCLNMLLSMLEKLNIEKIEIVIFDNRVGFYFPYQSRDIVFSSVLELSKRNFDDYEEDSKFQKLMETLCFSNTIGLNTEMIISSKKIQITIYNEETKDIGIDQNKILPLHQITEFKLPFIIVCRYDELEEAAKVLQRFIASESDTEINEIIQKGSFS